MMRAIAPTFLSTINVDSPAAERTSQSSCAGHRGPTLYSTRTPCCRGSRRCAINAHIRILWNERVDHVDARGGLMIVSEVQMATAGGDSFDIADGTELDRTDPVAHLIDGRSFHTSQRHSDGTPVELQDEVAQDDLPVRSRLDRRDRVVAVAIEAARRWRGRCSHRASGRLPV